MTHKEPVRFNPYTGAARDARDIQSDPQGVLIVPPGAVKVGATNSTQAKSIGAAPVELPESDGHSKDSLPGGRLMPRRGPLPLIDALALSARPVETVRALQGAPQRDEEVDSVVEEVMLFAEGLALETADARQVAIEQGAGAALVEAEKRVEAADDALQAFLRGRMCPHPGDARMVSLDDVIARLEQGFGKGCAPATTLLHHFGATEGNA